MKKRRISYLIIFIPLFVAATASAQVTFTDVTNGAGLGHFTEGDLGISSTWGDYDNDGDADLLLFEGDFDLVGDWRGPITAMGLYRNDGDGGFLDVTQAAGISDISLTGSSAIFMDFDNDGDLDLFTGGGHPLRGKLSGYPRSGDFLYRNNGNGTFTDISELADMDDDDTSPLVAFGISFDYDSDGLLDIYVAHWVVWASRTQIRGPYPNTLYHNEGNGVFREVAAEMGLDKPEYSFGIVLGDYDNDEDLDIFITVYPAPDFGLEVEQEMVLYRNDSGTFVDVAQEAGLTGKITASEAFFWDYDNDGDLDLFVQSVDTYDADDINILYRNEGDGTFTDVTRSAGLALLNHSASGSYYGDYDNDGWLDLWVTYDLMPTLLYHNNRDGTFTNAAREAGITAASTGTTSFVDYDNDGDLDVFISPWIGMGARLYRNNGTGNHWLQLRLVGQQSNRDAIGARVNVTAGRLQMLQEVAGSSAAGTMQDRLPLHFGLGENLQADEIEIRWPSGIVQTLRDIPADQRLTIGELEGVLVVIYSVSPNSGDPAGGTPVLIQGEHFLPGSRVLFGGLEAEDAQVLSSTLIAAVTPPAAKDIVDVEVLHPDGKRAILRDGFRYRTLQVTRITPESGPVAGGTTVRLEGKGFQPGAEVKIGENPLTDVLVTPGLIRGTTRPGEPGVVDVVVANPDGDTDILPRAFTYVPPPVITRIYPARFVPLPGGGEITILGSEFDAGCSIQIGGAPCRKVEFISSEELNVTDTPEMLDTGPHDVAVINPDGQSAVLAEGVTVLAPIKLKSVEPARGRLEGGTPITIVGEPAVTFKPQIGAEREYPSRFVWVAQVLIGDAKAEVVTVSDNVIAATTPPNTPGPKDVVVINADGQEDKLEDAFTYSASPQITRVTPNNGRLAGGTRINIQGSGFMPGAEVRISINQGTYRSASSVEVMSSSVITALTPPGQPGAENVLVLNPDMQIAVLSEGFTYNPMPTITRVTPNHGPASGGSKLNIEGTGFMLGARVLVGERAGTTMVRDDMTIEAVAPPNPPGAWDVRVVNPDTQEAVKREAYLSLGELVYNYPNPFHASQGTTFRYVTNRHVQRITVKIFNLRGRPIGAAQQMDSNEVRWADPDVHAGLYVYLVEVEFEDGKRRQVKNVMEVVE